MSAQAVTHIDTMTHTGFNVISMFCLSALPDKKPVHSFRSCKLLIYGKCVCVCIETGLQEFLYGLMEMMIVIYLFFLQE